MPAHRKDDNAEAMAALYLGGHSLEEVAAAFACTRQNVYKVLKLRGMVLRPPKRLPFITWKGMKFTIGKDGYYRRTDGDRERLHRVVWVHHKGPIPDGYDVHHKNGDKTRNQLGNLELLSCEEHGAAHGFGGNQHTGSLGTRPVK